MTKETIQTYNNPKTGKIGEKKDWIWTGYGAKAVIEYLVELGEVIFTENKGFKLKVN